MSHVSGSDKHSRCFHGNLSSSDARKQGLLPPFVRSEFSIAMLLLSLVLQMLSPRIYLLRLNPDCMSRQLLNFGSIRTHLTPRQEGIERDRSGLVENTIPFDVRKFRKFKSECLAEWNVPPTVWDFPKYENQALVTLTGHEKHPNQCDKKKAS